MEPARITVTLGERSPRWVQRGASIGVRGWCLATATWRALPDYLIIGTKRGGTTSLHQYILGHPDVAGLIPAARRTKRTGYFAEPTLHPERWMRSHFPLHATRSWHLRRTGQHLVVGESSPLYLWDPRVAERTAQVAPHARAIALLREPAARALSHYRERVANGAEDLPFATALEQEQQRTAGELDRMLADPGYISRSYDWHSYRARGVYLPQLRNWLEHFPDEQLLVLRSEDLYRDPQRVYDEVCDFLGLSPHQLQSPEVHNASTVGVRDDEVQASLSELADFYRPHNAELERFLERPMGWDR